MRFAFGARTDVGRGRPANEDAYFADPEAGLYAVADGMGGHRAGEVASATAIDTLRNAFAAGERLDAAVEAANVAVFDKAEENVDMRGMGTTLTAVALREGRYAVIAHVGDSRAYLLRDGAIAQVTEDHSLVEQLVREGRLSPEEAANHPQRAIITRALGIEPEVEVDLYEIELRPGDRVLVCSDGLSNMVSNQGMTDALRQHADPQAAADVLVDAANAAGGDDNITVVIVDALADMVVEGAVVSTVAAEERPAEMRTGISEAVPVESPSAESPAPLVEPPAPSAERATRPRRRVARRVLLWALPIVVLVGAGFTVVGWYARRTFYVGLAGEQVALYRGVPGGILGWDPTIEERSDLAASDLTPKEREDLEEGQRFSSKGEASRYLARLERTRPVDTAADGSEPDGATQSESGTVGPTTTTSTTTTR